MMMNYVVELLHTNDGDIVGECMYAKWMWNWWWILLLNMCIVCHMFMHH